MGAVIDEHGDEPAEDPDEELAWPAPRRRPPAWVRRGAVVVVALAAVVVLVRVHAGGHPRAHPAATSRAPAVSTGPTYSPTFAPTYAPPATVLRTTVILSGVPVVPVALVDPAACPARDRCVTTDRVPDGWAAAVRARFPGARAVSVTDVTVRSPKAQRGSWSCRVRWHTAHADVTVLLRRDRGGSHDPGSAVALSATSAHVVGVTLRRPGDRVVQIDVRARSGAAPATYGTLEALARDPRLLSA